ncbi:unnamed protein product, partial [Leptidea sinapis]
MDSEHVLQGDVSDGAEMSPLDENQPEILEEIDENNIKPDEAEVAQTPDDAIANGSAPTSSSELLSLDQELEDIKKEENLSEDAQDNAEAEDEMDIDETTPGAVGDDSIGAYIGDNCLSTPITTEDNSPQDEGHLDGIVKSDEMEGEPEEMGPQEESPDQSISSAMPMEGDGVDIKDESSTMDDDIGGAEGVASSDDVNDISSAAHESLAVAISFGDADTSQDMEGAADTMPTESDSMPLLTMTANGSAILTSSLIK